MMTTISLQKPSTEETRSTLQRCGSSPAFHHSRSCSDISSCLSNEKSCNFRDTLVQLRTKSTQALKTHTSFKILGSKTEFDNSEVRYMQRDMNHSSHVLGNDAGSGKSWWNGHRRKTYPPSSLRSSPFHATSYREVHTLRRIFTARLFQISLKNLETLFNDVTIVNKLPICPTEKIDFDWILLSNYWLCR